MLGKQIKSLQALKGVSAADITEEQIKAVNEEFTALGFEGLVVSNADNTVVSDLEEKVGTLEGSITTLTDERDDFKAAVSTLKTANTKLKGDLKELGGKPADDHSEIKGDEDADADSDDSDEYKRAGSVEERILRENDF